MQPRLLLLDEPLAGAGAEETERLVALSAPVAVTLRNSAGRARHAGRIRVGRSDFGPGQGRIIVTGDAATIRDHQEVRPPISGRTRSPDELSSWCWPFPVGRSEQLERGSGEARDQAGGQDGFRGPGRTETVVLHVENLTTGYGQSQVLFGISLDVAQGEVLAVLGRNGMGKTTTVSVRSSDCCPLGVER